MSESTSGAYFDALYRADDPWGYGVRWYEQRKRDLLLATLTRARFTHAWEIGCANGALTVELAARCDVVLATDLNARAVELTQARVESMPHVTVQAAHHPVDWPDATFDLIVFSEVGYYLSQADLDTTCARLRKAMAPDGLLVACHWLSPFAEAPLTGHDVHETLRDGLGMRSAFHYADQDFVLEGWSADRRSIAMREGLR